MTCRGKKSRFHGIGNIGLPLGFAEFVGCPPPLGDVGKCDDNTFHRTALGTVWQYAPDVPGAAPRFDLALDRLEALQHRLRVGQQGAVRGQRRKVAKRSPDVAGNDAEQ